MVSYCKNCKSYKNAVRTSVPNDTFMEPKFYHDFPPYLAEDIQLYIFDILESDAISVGQQFYPSIYLDIKHDII